MAQIVINPATLIAGTLGVPILSNAIGRTFITAKEAHTEAEVDSEVHRLIRNFAIYNGVLALALGYAAARGGLSEGWRSAALGGAIGTGLTAALLGVGLATGPEKVAPAKETAATFAGWPGVGTGRALPAKHHAWTSIFVDPKALHGGFAG